MNLTNTYRNTSSLRYLSLHENRFFGTVDKLFIDPSIANSLEVLDLSANELTGEIPDILFRNSRNLSLLSLSKNCFSGEISASVCYLRNIKSLLLDGLANNEG